jgi:hypothetical protein
MAASPRQSADAAPAAQSGSLLDEMDGRPFDWTVLGWKTELPIPQTSCEQCQQVLSRGFDSDTHVSKPGESLYAFLLVQLPYHP